MIRMKNVVKSFDDNKVLNGLNLEIQDGEILVIMGASGSGKSVTIKHLIGLEHPDEGEVWINDNNMTELRGAKLYNALLDVGFIFQSGALFDSMNVYENVAFYLEEHRLRGRKKIAKADIRQYVEEALASVGLPDVLDLNMSELSGGMKKRVGIARSLVYRPSLLIYDEPTTGLDPMTSRIIAELILKVHNELEGATTILVSHDLIAALSIADRIAFLVDGKIKIFADPHTFIQSDEPTIAYFREIIGNDMSLIGSRKK